MKRLTSRELRELYQKFFEMHDHKRIASASLVPENDPSVLFTTAGMHPLVPYLVGESHPSGKRLTDVQKCIRTGDIDEVGDNSHLTFFEMLGNWSLGDYFKKEAIQMSFEFLTSKDYLDIPKEKLYFTVFAGDEELPRDEESYNAWKSCGVSDDHIFFLPKENNFWILGSGVGPCGPDSEMFYDTGKEKCSEECDPSCSCGKYLEIWNDVFMGYFKDENGIKELEQKNVDTGMGLERVVCVLNGLESVYDTDLFENMIKRLEEISNKKYEDNKRSFRIILDHIRAAAFILGDEKTTVPSNVGAGYVLRKILRRTIREFKKLEINDSLWSLAKVVVEDYHDIYPELKKNESIIESEIKKEEEKFLKTLKDGERLFYKMIRKTEGNIISGEDAFKLFDTFGFPLEMTKDLAMENNLTVDEDGFNNKFKEHQEKSKSVSAGVFKGGLADHSYESTKYHTLCHLLLATLREKFGTDVYQKGSNITPERLRFDFNLDHKMTDEEKEWVTNRVNEMINSNTDVTFETMSVENALASGAIGSFNDRYNESVKVYTIGNLSKEICGGPHVKNTSELGTFKIVKEESSSSGVRRIKAILE